MKEEYLQQAELVVRCIPSIEPCFAIKGDTAINLFELIRRQCGGVEIHPLSPFWRRALLMS
jgi:hypothetical protein